MDEDLLRDYADRGGTVLLSSHLLREIEIIADDIVMIGNGRIVSQGSKTELLEAAGTVVRAPDMHALRRARHVRVDTTVTGDGALRTDAAPTGSGGGDGSTRAAHRAARRRRRPRGHVPPAHRRHPTRKDSGMTAITIAPVREHLAEVHQVPLAGDPRRAAQDVRHPIRLLADGEHRHRWPHRHRGDDRVRPRRDLTYYTFAKAIGFPMTVVLPMIAILSITGEWSQRSA